MFSMIMRCSWLCEHQNSFLYDFYFFFSLAVSKALHYSLFLISKASQAKITEMRKELGNYDEYLQLLHISFVKESGVFL